MDYRFEISKPDSNDFRCEIAINGEQTFQQLHDKLVETLNFDGSHMDLFFTLDKMGNRGKEIALMEMSADDEEDNNTLVMDVTTIREVVNASCIELEYVYDFFANQYLKVEYAGKDIGDSAVYFCPCVSIAKKNCPIRRNTMPMKIGLSIKTTTNMTIVLWRNSVVADAAEGEETTMTKIFASVMKTTIIGTIVMATTMGMTTAMKVWTII
ncbi:MAG: hypothetical protein V8T44_00665 [Odoribacter splanchnicus]